MLAGHKHPCKAVILPYLPSPQYFLPPCAFQYPSFLTPSTPTYTHSTPNVPAHSTPSPPSCLQVLGEVIKAGATTLNIPDTTGWNLPHEFGDLIAKIRANTPGADRVIISTHCQNDLGLSTANSIAGAMAGVWRAESLGAHSLFSSRQYVLCCAALCCTVLHCAVLYSAA